MMVAEIFFSARQWMVPAALLLLAGLGLLFWNYAPSPLPPRWKAFCALLKTLGMALLLACLLEPLWSGERAKPGANYMAVLADNSMGMQIREAGGAAATRGDRLRDWLKPDQDWEEALAKDFVVRKYLFDSGLQSVPDFQALDFQGRSTSLQLALHQLRDRFRGQPLAGILLFTDGLATDMPETPDLTGLPPIYPVLVGEGGDLRDLSIRKVLATQTGFEDAPVTVQVEVDAAGFEGRVIEVELQPDRPPEGAAAMPESARQVQKQRVKQATAAFRFEVRPARRGVTFYQVRVQPEQPAPEATDRNNRAWVAVDRGSRPYRILYVSGRPNWDYKFLNRSLQEDEYLQMVALIRIANREPKFEFRGRSGETSNPLFRGFGQTDETTERYDQPVLIRLNTRDEQELRTGFPKVEEDLFQYDALVVDDVEAAFFTREQMSLIQRFVTERGGGFMMLGGQETFSRGKYERTPIGEMLPVYLDRVMPPRPHSQWRLQLTPEGWLQPWVRLRAHEQEEKNRLNGLPPFQVMNLTGGTKPGASVLAVASDGSQTIPAMVIQRFGSGRAAALAIGDFWRAGLQDENSQKDLAKAWRQLLRWLVVDTPSRFTLEVQPAVRGGQEGMQLVLRAKDRKFQALENGSVQFSVQPVHPSAPGQPQEKPVSPTLVAAEPSLDQPGAYEAFFLPRESGPYVTEALFADMQGVEQARVSTGWTAPGEEREFQQLQPNRGLLELLARQTGGRMLAHHELERFARELPFEKVPVTQLTTLPLWHQPWVFLMALACFAAEWGFRRSKGLA